MARLAAQPGVLLGRLRGDAPLRGRLEQLREGEGRRRHEEAKQAEHKEWLAEQKRQLVEARVLRVRGGVSVSARVSVSVTVRVSSEP